MVELMSNSIDKAADLISVINKFMMFMATEIGYSKNTILAYKSDLEDFIDSIATIHKKSSFALVDLQAIQLQDVRYWLQLRHKRELQIRSNMRAIASLRTFFKYLNDNNITDNTAIFKVNKPKSPRSLPKAMEVKDVMALIDATSQISEAIWQQKRDFALLLMIFSAGLRINEALSLLVSDLYDHGNRDFLYIKGKGNKQRIVPLLLKVKSAIDDYMQVLPFHLIGTDYIFVSNRGKRYSARAVQKKIAIVRNSIGLPSSVTPHALRHSCATALLAHSGDIVKVKHLLGHSRLSTTQIYTHINTEHLSKELEKVGFWDQN